jgi:hypothetical protein
MSTGSREMLVVINDIPYRIRVLEQPVDQLGRKCKSCLNHDKQCFDVKASLPASEWFEILGIAMDLPEGSVIWEARSLVEVDVVPG